LAHFAARAGARRVYAIERGPAIALAELVHSANDPDRRIALIEGDSRQVELPERANVLLTETLWNFGLGEGIVGAIIDARARLLTPDARILPSDVELIIALVEDPALYRPVELWRQDLYGIDFSPLRTLAANNHHPVTLDAAGFLAVPTTLARVSLGDTGSPDVSGVAPVRVRRSGTAHGIGGWFRAQLSPGVALSNAPPLRTPNWRQVFFPLQEPRPVERGETLVVSIRSTGNGGIWVWDVKGSEARRGSRQSTLWGFPLRQPLMSAIEPSER
jgi:type I protein arginine methyltransferase